MIENGTCLTGPDGSPAIGGKLELSFGNIPMDRQRTTIVLDAGGWLPEAVTLHKGQSMRLVDAKGKVLWQLTRTR